MPKIDLDDLLSYQTVKYVTIRERKLGIIHLVLQFIIFTYIVLYTIIYQQRYLLPEAPYGSIRATVREPESGYPNAATLPYCLQNQSTYNSLDNYECVYMRGTDITYPPGQVSTIFVGTRIKDSYYNVSENCRSEPLNPTSYECVPAPNPFKKILYYVADVEDFTLYMEHSIFGRQTELLVANFNCDGKMELRNGSKATIPFDQPYPNRTGDILDMQTIMNAANVASLDGSSGLGHSYRYDGALIVAVVNYENYITDPKRLYYTYKLYVMPDQDVISMEPSKVLPDGTTVQRNWYGVRVLFMVVGLIGVFDFPTLLTSLVNGMVLIKVSTVIVDLIILYIMPSKKVYSAHKFESTEIESHSTPLKPGNFTSGKLQEPLLSNFS